MNTVEGRGSGGTPLDDRRVALTDLYAVAGWVQLAVARSSMQGRAAHGTRMAGGEADTRHAVLRATASSPAQKFGAVTPPARVVVGRDGADSCRGVPGPPPRRAGTNRETSSPASWTWNGGAPASLPQPDGNWRRAGTTALHLGGGQRACGVPPAAGRELAPSGRNGPPLGRRAARVRRRRLPEPLLPHLPAASASRLLPCRCRRNRTGRPRTRLARKNSGGMLVVLVTTRPRPRARGRGRRGTSRGLEPVQVEAHPQ